ncbi:hypothetical protein HaLaN_22955, partial [Haematococcus lacustris]
MFRRKVAATPGARSLSTNRARLTQPQGTPHHPARTPVQPAVSPLTAKSAATEGDGGAGDTKASAGSTRRVTSRDLAKLSK